MTDPLAPVGDGHTAVPEELRDQLLPTYIATLGDLFEAEEENIAAATYRRRPSVAELLDDRYLKALHKAMFGRVWRWAGTYRRHLTNIGIDWVETSVAVRNLVEDTRVRVSAAAFPPDEIAIRFHHRLVQIHPFVNGNGRHGRFAAEYLVEALGRHRFSWGANLGAEGHELRKLYREALQRIDRDPEDVESLLAFARS